MLLHIDKIINRSFLFCLMGIIVFSPFSSDLALDYLHLPMSAPELFALPFCFFLKRDIKKVRINKQLFLRLLGLMFILIIFALLVGEYSFFSILGSARAYFWIFFFYCVFKSSQNPFCLDDLMYISLGCLIGWLLSSLIGIRNILLTLLDEGVTYGALLAVPLLLSISYYKKKYLLFSFGLVVIVLICVTSGIRRLIFISLISLALVALLSVINRPKYIFRITIGLCLFGVLLIATLPLIKDYMKETSHSLYHRVFERSETYLEGDVDDSDSERLYDITVLLEDSWKYIIPPRGFVSRQTATDTGAGDFNDLPLKELFWTFSLPGALLILFHYMRKTMYYYSHYRKKEDEMSYVIICYMTIMFCLLFLEGTFLAFPYATPITGACLGLVDKKNHKR